MYVYSGAPLLWTLWGPGKVSYIERCPHFRGKFLLGKHIWVTAKCPEFRGVLGVHCPYMCILTHCTCTHIHSIHTVYIISPSLWGGGTLYHLCNHFLISGNMQIMCIHTIVPLPSHTFRHTSGVLTHQSVVLLDTVGRYFLKFSEGITCRIAQIKVRASHTAKCLRGKGAYNIGGG